GLSPEEVTTAVERLRAAGAGALVASEAYGVEDPAGELMAMQAAERMAMPACAGHELTGLYGLAVRTVTATLNASILPTAFDTARTVEDAVSRDAPGVPLLVMRGDGGAADIAAMRRRPLLTAFSGPAASVTGALRHLSVRDGIVVEVGGTSTNVSVIKGGRPVLSYVRVLDHVTSVRSLDVRVTGVAGGSLIRVRRGGSRLRVDDVGPRSAHIAGLPYASFQDATDLAQAEARLVAPRPGDPEAYVVLEGLSGASAPTLTCAANAIGTVPGDSYASADRDAATAAFEAVGRFLGRNGLEVAREVVSAAARKVAAVVDEAAKEHGLREPVIVGLGGGAGALIPSLAEVLGLSWEIPEHAEVISSIGDALSLVRVEVERGMPRPTTEAVSALVREVEAQAIEAGASPSTLVVETTSVPERGAMRAVAFGSVSVEAGVRAAEAPDAYGDALTAVAAEILGPGAIGAGETEFYAAFVAPGGPDRKRRFAVIDRKGSVALEGEGLVLAGTGDEVAGSLNDRLPGMVKRFGPVGVAPAVRVVRGPRLVDLSIFSSPDRALEAAVTECRLADGHPVLAVLSRD
ncbi:MAG TPA: hydantoinase/oxoprolinase family protein, partial [Actinomycetota bacterium]|nr:hydantoinase/oxoprolinase family protein [Actinomycetota bacterium]